MTRCGNWKTGERRPAAAGRLDRHLLVDHDSSGFLDLLAPNAQADLRAKFDAGKLGSYVTVIDPTATLHAQLPRIKGSTSFDSRRRAGATVLDVVTNYVVAYPFANGEVVLAQSETHWWFYRDSDVAKADVGLWPSTVDGYVFNLDCEAFFRGTVAPPSGYDPYAQGDLNDDPDAFYDPEHSLDAPGSSCARPSPAASP